MNPEVKAPSAAVDKLRLILVGNPNSGKTSLFNALTGLNQRVGNYPGVTVDKKSGSSSISKKVKAEVIDLPGTYSLDPQSEDERVAANYLSDKDRNDINEIVVVVVDATNLKRSLLLATQLIDLHKPVLIALNMMDIVQKNQHEINIELLAKTLGVPVVPMNARIGKGINDLKEAVGNYDFSKSSAFLSAEAGTAVGNDTLKRYAKINELIKTVSRESGTSKSSIRTKKIDRVLMHPVAGYLIFLSILFIVFQAIFSWAEAPMTWIEDGFLWTQNQLAALLPEGILNDLIVNGIVAGIGGIAVFIPQIAFLFAFIAILEDTGYLARVSVLMDALLKRFGLNGKSIIPLLGGAACAIPAIMSARTISNRKERLLTIFITPLISCSARIPVYTLLIALVVPSESSFGIFNLQGIVMMGLYLLGFCTAIITAFFMKYWVKNSSKSHFVMEMPIYRPPRWSNIGITIVNKVKVFLFEAGKIIIAISIVLWALSSYGPSDKFEEIEARYATELAENPDLEQQMATEKLEASYAGHLGRFIEPVIRPLGFDWKIGIAIITSFAAREVFVGTMATIYSVGDEENTKRLKEKLQKATFSDTGEKVYTKATAYSLLIFYAFALQCMATVAVVVRETNGWKWPILQLLYMSSLAYVSSLIVYQVFS